MPDTTAPVKTWPTEADSRRIANTLYEGITPVDELATTLRQMIDDDDSESLSERVAVPTYEEIGILAAIVEDLREQSETLEQYLDQIRECSRVAATRRGGSDA
jgi:hypothetical protein